MLSGRKRMTLRKTKITGLILLAGVLLVCFAGWWLWSIPFSEATLKKLAPGMSQKEVLSILGSTDETVPGSNEETWWIYSHRPVCIRALIVVFDKDGHLLSYVID